MVKMVVGEVQTQTSEIQAFCQSYSEALESVSSATNEIQLAVGLEGAGMDGIKNYLSTVYPALCRAAILHSEATTQANKAYIDGYTGECGGEDLDSEELEDQIRELEATIQGFQANQESLQQYKRDLTSAELVAMGPTLQEMINNAASGIARNEAKKAKLEEKLQKFLAFCGQSTSYFDGLSETESLLTQGMSALGVNDDGSIGAGSWNGTGFSLKDASWIAKVNEKWGDRSLTPEQKFAKNLKEQYGFDDETVSYLIKVKEGLANRFPRLTARELDYLFNRLIGGLIYGNPLTDNLLTFGLDKNKWGQTAGELTKYFNSIDTWDDIFASLGLSEEEYRNLWSKIYLQHIICYSETNSINSNNIADFSWLKEDVERILKRKLSDNEFMCLWNNNYANMSHSGDFAHQYITTATILDDSMNLTTIVYGQEKTDKLAGWLGDATIKGEDGLVSFGDDDYKADLDAANIVYWMNKNNCSYQEATIEYYSKINSSYNRAEVFLEFNKVEEIEREILIRLGIPSLLELEQQQSDAYNFIISLKNKSNTMLKNGQ